MKPSRDLGSAHAGFSDWYWQRLSAVVLLLLLPFALIIVWLVYLNIWDQLTLLHWLDLNVVRILHTLLLLALLTHAYIGLKVIFEDYVHTGIRTFFIGGSLILMTTLGLWWLSVVWAWGS